MTTRASPRRPALGRLPLLALGFVALIVGSGAGLARLGWPVPAFMAGAAAWHGPLMVGGFFGTVIAIERAVALGRPWAWLAPLASGSGALLLTAGAALPAALALLVASLVLLAATATVLGRQRERFVVVLTAAAAAWAVGNALWFAGAAIHEVVPWWLAFLVFTIAGERLELSRLRPPSRAAQHAFTAIAAATALGLVGSLPATGALAPWGVRLLGAALLALAAWLAHNDIARRTVRQRGLTRYIAVCLLSGYGWLAVGSAVMALGGLVPGSAAYDAALHALMLGFVFAMVFGHAPIILAAVLRVAVPYRPRFYAPLVLLHASVALRLAALAAGSVEGRRIAALLSAVALAAFVANVALAVRSGLRRDS